MARRWIRGAALLWVVVLASFAASLIAAASLAVAQSPTPITGSGPVVSRSVTRADGTVVRSEGSVTLIAPPGAERTLEALAPQAQEIVSGVSLALGIQPRAPYSMLLIPVKGMRDPQFLAFDRGAPVWAAGFMQPEIRMGAIRLAQAARYPYGTPEAVLAHESAHLLIHDAPGVAVPLWFEEGVATWSARAWQFEDVFQLSSRLMTHDLPKLDAIEPLFHGDAAQADQAYAASFAFISWSVSRYGGSVVRDILTESRTHSFERAWRIATGVPLDRAESAWRRESLFRYRWMPLIAGSGSLWLVVMLLAALAWVRRRRRARLLELAWQHESEDWADTGEWAEGLGGGVPTGESPGVGAPADEAAPTGEPTSTAEPSPAPLSPPQGAFQTPPVVPGQQPPPNPPTLVWRRAEDDEQHPPSP